VVPEPVEPTEPPPAGQAPPFAGLVTVSDAQPGSVQVTPVGGGAPLELRTGPGQVLEDELLSADAVGEEIKPGTGVWLLGKRVEKQGRLKPFGRIVVRTVEDVSFGFVAGTVLPDSSWEDAAAPGRKWLFGKVELSFPVFRVTIDGTSYLLSEEGVKILTRKDHGEFSRLTTGRMLWVKGTREDGTITPTRVVILSDALENEPAYRAWYASGRAPS
jgi:hypothetical protein